MWESLMPYALFEIWNIEWHYPITVNLKGGHQFQRVSHFVRLIAQKRNYAALYKKKNCELPFNCWYKRPLCCSKLLSRGHFATHYHKILSKRPAPFTVKDDRTRFEGDFLFCHEPKVKMAAEEPLSSGSSQMLNWICMHLLFLLSHRESLCVIYSIMTRGKDILQMFQSFVTLQNVTLHHHTVKVQRNRAHIKRLSSRATRNWCCRILGWRTGLEKLARGGWGLLRHWRTLQIFRALAWDFAVLQRPFFGNTFSRSAPKSFAGVSVIMIAK